MPVDRQALRLELHGLERELRAIRIALPSRRSRVFDDLFLGLGLLAMLVGLFLLPITSLLSLGLTLIGAARLVYAAIKYADTAVKAERLWRRQTEIHARITEIEAELTAEGAG